MADDSQLRTEAVDALLDEGDWAGARAALARVESSDDKFAVLRIKLALLEGSVTAGAAMQALIQLMRKNPDWPGAKALYQTASSNAFETRQSSHSHSHPPPAVERSATGSVKPEK